MTEQQKKWYCDQIKKIDPKGDYVKLDTQKEIIIFTNKLKSDEANQKNFNPEELVHALIFCLLVSKKYKYSVDKLYHEKYFRHGSSGSLSDEVDYLIYDDDKLPYALWEIKAASEYNPQEKETIQYQLFGTAPLVGAPKYLVYATIFPKGITPIITLKCIDYTVHQSYESWEEAESPSYKEFPVAYQVEISDKLTPSFQSKLTPLS